MASVWEIIYFKYFNIANGHTHCTIWVRYVYPLHTHYFTIKSLCIKRSVFSIGKHHYAYHQIQVQRQMQSNIAIHVLHSINYIFCSNIPKNKGG